MFVLPRAISRTDDVLVYCHGPSTWDSCIVQVPWCISWLRAQLAPPHWSRFTESVQEDTCTSHRWVAIDIKVSQTVLCICNTTWPRVRLYRFLVKLVRSWKSTPFPGKSERSLRHRQSLALDSNNAASEDFWTCTTVSAFWLEVAAPHTSMCALYCQPPSLSPVQIENPSKQHVPHNTWSNI